MEYKLKRHKIDPLMIEAFDETEKYSYLAFIEHEDNLLDEEIIGALEDYGECIVEMKLKKGK